MNHVNDSRVQTADDDIGPSRLGNLERTFMNVLWNSSEPMSAREIQAAYAERGLAYATVRTVLNRLASKGLVSRVRADRAWLYEPSGTREAFVAELMLQALDMTGDRDAALVYFARSVRPPDADTLRGALDPDED